MLQIRFRCFWLVPAHCLVGRYHQYCTGWYTGLSACCWQFLDLGNLCFSKLPVVYCLRGDILIRSWQLRISEISVYEYCQLCNVCGHGQVLDFCNIYFDYYASVSPDIIRRQSWASVEVDYIIFRGISVLSHCSNLSEIKRLISLAVFQACIIWKIRWLSGYHGICYN